MNRRDSLAACGKEVNREKPFLERQLALAEDRPRFNREILLATRAPIPPTAFELINGLMPAMRAIGAVAKPNRRKMPLAYLLVLEMVDELPRRNRRGFLFRRSITYVFKLVV